MNFGSPLVLGFVDVIAVEIEWVMVEFEEYDGMKLWFLEMGLCFCGKAAENYKFAELRISE